MLCWLRRLDVMETPLRMYCQLMRVRCCSSLLLSPGNWGSAIAKIVGINTKKAFFFQDEVQMYVYEEIYKGRKLHELINETHENPKYLPGIALPHNIRAVSNIREVVANAHVLIFVMPHQFVKPLCHEIQGHILPGAKAISLVKVTLNTAPVDGKAKGMSACGPGSCLCRSAELLLLLVCMLVGFRL